MNTSNTLHLHLFDGEGGAGDGQAGDGAGVAEPEIIYGKADDSIDNGNAQEVTVQENPDEDFESLINGKYKQQFGAKVQDIIQRRFKNDSDANARLSEYERSLEPLYGMYGVDNPADLAARLQNTDAIYAERAEAAGLTIDQYKERLTLEAEAARGRQLQQQMEQQRASQQQYDAWVAEAEQLKEALPNFDLARECENPEFVDYLSKGIALDKAFMLTHMDEFIAGNNNAVAEEAKQNVVSQIRMRNQRPAEASISSPRAVIRKSNVNELTDKDIDAINERVARGEKISF